MERAVLTQARGRGRRRSLLVLVAGAVIALAVPWAMMSAGATVSNPGAITVVFGCPAVSPPAGCIGQLALNGTTPITIDGINGTGTGTIDGAGVMNFPLAGLSFTPFNILVAGAIPATVTIEPTADWTGNLDPATGAMTLHGPLLSHLSDGGALLGTDCPVGPLDLNLTTGTSGAATGTPYASATGFGIVVDNDFIIPPTPDPNATCTGATLINSAAPLPLAKGQSTTKLSMLFSPAPQPGVASTTTIAPTTTTAAPTTTTTTLPPTTTTTAAPTTTTTAAPTTTTTRRADDYDDGRADDDHDRRADDYDDGRADDHHHGGADHDHNRRADDYDDGRTDDHHDDAAPTTTTTAGADHDDDRRTDHDDDRRTDHDDEPRRVQPARERLRRQEPRPLRSARSEQEVRRKADRRDPQLGRHGLRVRRLQRRGHRFGPHHEAPSPHHWLSPAAKPAEPSQSSP